MWLSYWCALYKVWFYCLRHLIHVNTPESLSPSYLHLDTIKVSTHTLRAFSTSFLEGRFCPSNTSIGLTLKVNSMSTNFMQYHTYLGLDKFKCQHRIWTINPHSKVNSDKFLKTLYFSLI